MAWIILVAVAIVFAVLVMGVMVYLAVHLTRMEAGLRQAAALFNQLAESLDKLAAPLNNLTRRTKPKPPDHPETWDPELGCMTPAIAASAVYRSKTHATLQAPPAAARKRPQMLRRTGIPKSRRGAILTTRRKRRPMRRTKTAHMLSKPPTAGNPSGLATATVVSLPDLSLTIPAPLTVPALPSQRKKILGSFALADT